MTGLVSLWFFKSLQELPPGKAGLSTWHGICSEKAAASLSTGHSSSTEDFQANMCGGWRQKDTCQN